MPFDIGFIELCVLLVVGLMILGPDKLPVAARQLSKWFGHIRRNVNSFKSEMSRELEMDELRRQFEAQKKQIDSVSSLAPVNAKQDNNTSKPEGNVSVRNDYLQAVTQNPNESSLQANISKQR